MISEVLFIKLDPALCSFGHGLVCKLSLCYDVLNVVLCLQNCCMFSKSA